MENIGEPSDLVACYIILVCMLHLNGLLIMIVRLNTHWIEAMLNLFKYSIEKIIFKNSQNIVKSTYNICNIVYYLLVLLLH